MPKAAPKLAARTNKPNKTELDLANRSNDHTDDDNRDVSKSFKADGRNAESPSSEQRSDRVCCLKQMHQRMPSDCSILGDYLQHLDERYTQMQIDQIAENQTQTEKETNRYDSTANYSQCGGSQSTMSRGVTHK